MGFLDFLKRGPRKKQCSRCGQQAAHGYSQVQESEANQIEPLCFACLTEQLHRDYSNFSGHAVVIAPAAGLPCYVFREQRILSPLLSRIDSCVDCKAQAHCLWMQSQGLTIETFDDVLEKGLEQTLLTWGNPAGEPLCGTCTAKRIGKRLQSGDLEFFEICSPHDAQEGFVLPTAY
jgi:hypothetical protein